MLEALSPGSRQGGRGWRDATRLRLLPRQEHHLPLPDGISAFPLGSALVCKSLLTADVRRSAAFPCQCVGWQ